MTKPPLSAAPAGSDPAAQARAGELASGARPGPPASAPPQQGAGEGHDAARQAAQAGDGVRSAIAEGRIAAPAEDWGRSGGEPGAKDPAPAEAAAPPSRSGPAGAPLHAPLPGLMPDALSASAAAPVIYPLAGRRVWVAGHGGMVGAALVRRLARSGAEILTAPRAALDLRDPAAVAAFLAHARPQAIFLAAARVGGIEANRTRPADFLYDNLALQTAVIHAAWRAGVEKLMVLGSSCIYPREAPQPIPEEALLSGPLEPTNEAYAIAKIAGLKLAQAYRRQHGADFIAAQPTNLYGPGDNYDLTASHVLPALIRRAAEAAATGAPLTVWGSGAPLREFLHADDLADALVFLMERYSEEGPINVGSGEEVSIRRLAGLCAEAAAGPGRPAPRLVFDPSKPDGTPRKLVDRRRLLALGWNGARPLEQGIEQAMADWLAGKERRRGAA